MATMIRSRRSLASSAYEFQPLSGRLVSTMPPPSPGAAMRRATFFRPSSVRVSMVTERLPWFRPAQYRLRSWCKGQRSMSIPPPGGSTRITSAPRAARVAPPRGAAMNADSSTTRRPSRIGLAELGGIVDGLGALLNEARGQRFVNVIEDRGRTRPLQLFDLPLGGIDLGSNLIEHRGFAGRRPVAFPGCESADALDGVASLRLSDLVLLAIFLRIVRRVVEADPVGPAFDQGRASSRQGPVDGGRRRRVHREQVVAIDEESWKTVTVGSAGEIARRSLARHRRRDRVVVVDEQHHQGHAHDSGKVRRLVKVALRGRALAEIHRHDPAGAPQLEGPCEPGRVRQLSADGLT